MSTIKQKSVNVQIEEGRTVEVRRLRWKLGREFLKKFSAIASGVYKDAPEGVPFGKLILSKLPEIVSGSDELVTLLCTGSTDMTADQVDELSALSVLQVVEAAMGVNFDEELKKSWAGIGARVSALMSADAATTK